MIQVSSNQLHGHVVLKVQVARFHFRADFRWLPPQYLLRDARYERPPPSNIRTDSSSSFLSPA
eukprot:CAMPEP_0195582816 /NCGR_PEP_ID=MMETSP0814-20130614/22910_1 /TAXON_ID=97485 /ORGANISM="Prymnesium parvum, Strain Texoma1" /LENGTH=62 /DNA_ID=CAMNT_0040720481 /DNA_START=330 /DNA_END=515 /DNA_ORIENTATION=+